MSYKFYLLLVFMVSNFAFPDDLPKLDTDLIVFSYNRPLQLYALLESVQRYVSNLNIIHVLCRISNSQYKKAYQELETFFPKARFIYQSEEP
ncbi:MAG TPA: hypothetical protein VHA52_00440, partial [Candidatus Babeliaceae bacterium]|nr:hypothetical protein [Candidatus Babeliaceae bacterium]